MWWPRSAVSGAPVTVTTPSATVTTNRAGSIRNSCRMTSSTISARISPSGRSKTVSRSARLTIPTRQQPASTTGSRLTCRWYISRAACSTVSSGLTVTTLLVIRSPAVTPSAFSSSLWCTMALIAPPRSAFRASLASRSASETTPITLWSSSRTGNALTRYLRSSAAISLYDAPCLTATTVVVMTSLTVGSITSTPSLLVVAAEDDLQRAGVGGPGEDVVRLVPLVQTEVVGDEPLGVELAAGDQLQQGGGGVGVDQAGGDRDVPDPLVFQVQRDRRAVHADVRDPAAGPDQLDRQLEGIRDADGLDGHVRAEPPGQVPGQVPDDPQRVLAGVVHDHVGAEVLGRFEPGVGQVDRDDVARAEQLRAGDRGQADRARADYGDEITRADVAVEHADLVAGGEDIGQHEGLLVAEAAGYAVGGGVGERDADVLGLGAIDLVAEDPAAGAQALPVAAFAAEPAGPAGADAGDQRAVTARQRVHAVTDLDDRPDGLVAEDPALVHRGHVALEDVQVGTADGGRVDPHDGVVIADDLWVRYLFPGLLTGTVVNDGSHDCLLGSFTSSTSLVIGASARQGRRSVPAGLKVTAAARDAKWVTPLVRRGGCH